MGIKESLLDIADKLGGVEAVVQCDEVDALHASMRAALHEHGKTVGLSAEDIAEIDGHIAQARGGTPKTPQNQD